jgi:hypothetical protein
MSTTTTTTPATTDAPAAPKLRRSVSIGLHDEGGNVLRVMALRRRDGAVSYAVLSTPGPDGKKKVHTRGMTTKFTSWDLAVAAVDKLVSEAVKAGWTQRARRAGFEPRPDGFSTIPAPTTATPSTTATGKATKAKKK